MSNFSLNSCRLSWALAYILITSPKLPKELSRCEIGKPVGIALVPERGLLLASPGGSNFVVAERHYFPWSFYAYSYYSPGSTLLNARKSSPGEDPKCSAAQHCCRHDAPGVRPTCCCLLMNVTVFYGVLKSHSIIQNDMFTAFLSVTSPNCAASTIQFAFVDMAPAPGALEKEKGNEHFRAGRYVEAIGSYSAAIAADRKNPTYLLNRSQAYLKLYKFQDAVRDTSSCLALEPSNAKALFRRASAYKAMARFVEALNDLKKAQGLDNKNEQITQELDSVKELLTQQAQAEQKKKAQREAVTKPSVPRPADSSSPQTGSNNAKASPSTSALRSAVAQEGKSNNKPDMMEPLTTRRFEKSAASAEPPKPPPSPSQPKSVPEEKPSKPLSFAEAKQARAQRLGQFKPASPRPSSSSRSSSAEEAKPQMKQEESKVQPLTTAFEFSRAWREAQQASPEASQQARLQVLQVCFA